MPSVLIPMVDGFEEIEAITAIDLLRRAEIEVYTAGFGKKSSTGSHAITVETDIDIDEVKARYYDALLLPGGPGVKALKEDTRVLDLIQDFSRSDKVVAAICAAPSVLAKVGLLRGKTVACFPSVESELGDSTLSQEEVVVDGKIITSRGAGTAIPFALAVIEALTSADVAADVAEKIIYRAAVKAS